MATLKTAAQALETATRQMSGKPTVFQPPTLASSLLSAFQTLNNPQRELMVEEAHQFCAEMQHRRPARWLSILGPSGNGKTMLARLIFEYVQQQGSLFKIKAPGGEVIQQHRILWVNWRKACKAMRQGDFSLVEELSTDQNDRDYAVWCAVIDDIGAGDETSRGYLQNALETIVDSRLGAWTIFTSNLNLDQIGQQLDRRISSRMLRDGNRVLEVELPDWNLQ